MQLTDPFERFAADDGTPGRVALGIEYLGSHYRGWQTQQTGVSSIQPRLETALSRIAGEPISLMCAGRTDAGVHATGQVAHFDTRVARSSRAWVLGSNGELPADIRVRWAKPVSCDFHSRHSGLARRYRYVLVNHRLRPAQLRDQITWWNRPLDAEKMHRAAQCLVGEKDFSAFRSIRCESSTPWRHMHFIRVYRRGQLIVIDIQANAFLHHMVRNIVGTLMAVGQGDQPESWVQALLEGRQREVAGITAPAEGLYLIAVLYPERFGLPCEPLGPYFMHLLADEQPDDPYPAFLPEWHRSDLTRTRPRPDPQQETKHD